MGRGCAVLFLLTAASGCHQPVGNTSPGDGRSADGKLDVYVVNYPLQYFTQRIGGDLIDVHFPIPGGVDPAFWRPTAEQIAAFQQADLILLNGAQYAKWVQHASLPASRTVNTTAAVEQQYIHEADTIVHQHGPGGEHSHGQIAFTTWLDFQLAEQQAQAVHDQLSQRLPDQRATLADNLAALIADLQSLDQQMQTIAAASNGQPLVASHPVYQYLARRYELNVKSVHWEPDQMPDAAGWQQLEELRKDHPAQWMIWEAEPLPEVKDRLQEQSVGCVVFQPCGNAPDSGDFLAAMRANLNAMQAVFRHDGGDDSSL